ncbi:polysaccharide lyase family protein [Gemmata sp.]|uniref:polysaccharide lyase family protein n=1 Tax=Gemmata sp. TaxID=1914242 RepID=UPI003F6F234D
MCWFATLALLLAVPRFGPAPEGAGGATTPPVFDETPATATVDNGRVRLTFDKAKGVLRSLVYRERELLGPGGGYAQIAYTSRRDPSLVAWKFRLVRKGPDLVEVAFENADPRCPFDFAVHHVVRANEPGFHTYLTFGHDAARSPGVFKLAQYNWCLRVDPALFTTAAVDDRRITPFPKAADLTPDRTVMDATYRLPDGTHYSKYFFSAEMDERHTVHGAMSEKLGVWVVMPGHEHLNGGPEHQELTVHQGGASQVLLAHATAAHYGAGVLTSDSKAGSWSKASVPTFTYVNEGRDQAALWADAKARAAAEVARWPNPWLDDARFQLKRGTVTGRLAFDGGAPAAGARLVLADHEDAEPPLAWQQQWRGYRFCGWADRDGRFALPKVRPGRYDLYAWTPGEFGQFVKRDVRITPEGTAALGELTWDRPRGRDLLWQIGTPDRSAAEFGFAEDFRRWGLWDAIAAAHPNGATFVAGKSRDRDWPFQMAVSQNRDLSWHAPAWRVEFDVPAARTGTAVLTLGVAAYEGKAGPQLRVSLNGAAVGAVDDLVVSGAAHRSGVHAGYQERRVAFDAAKLKAGRNVLTFEMPPPARAAEKRLGAPAAALLWDCLRLEVDRAAAK